MSKNLSVRPLKCTPAVRLAVLGPMPHRGRGNAAWAVKNIYNSPSAQPLAPNGAAKRAPRPPRTACFAVQYGLFCNAKRQPAAAACMPATCRMARFAFPFRSFCVPVRAVLHCETAFPAGLLGLRYGCRRWSGLPIGDIVPWLLRPIAVLVGRSHCRRCIGPVRGKAHARSVIERGWVWQ